MSESRQTPQEFEKLSDDLRKQDDDWKSDIIDKSPKGRFLKFNEIIGTGAYKVVYRGYDNDKGCEVAWNSIKIAHLSKKERQQIVDEVKLLESLHSPNILQLTKAWCSSWKDEVVFITELITGGSLKQYLRKIKHPYLKVIKRWCRSVLNGIVYLHSQQPYPVIHRDLKCDNIFINSENGQCRIGDFGLSTIARRSHNTTVLGTPEYIAPEVFNENYGPKADVYSFGMWVLEMVTHHTPYRECQNPGAVVKKVIDRVYPKDLERVLDPEVKNFIQLCLEDEETRPTSSEVLKHEFLQEIENEKDHRPVDLAADISKVPTPPRPTKFAFAEAAEVAQPPPPRILHLQMDVVLNGQRKAINFDFSTEIDTVESVTDEFIEVMGVSDSKRDMVSKKIAELISRQSSQESPVAKILAPSAKADSNIQDNSQTSQPATPSNTYRTRTESENLIDDLPISSPQRTMTRANSVPVSVSP